MPRCLKSPTKTERVQSCVDRRGRRRPDRRRSTNFNDSAMTRSFVKRQESEGFGPSSSGRRLPASCCWAFDNILDTEKRSTSKSTKKGPGNPLGDWLVKKCPERRQGPRNSRRRRHIGDTDRHDGIHEARGKSGKKWAVVEVVGQVGRSDRAEATADAIAVQKHFDASPAGVTPGGCRPCSTPSIRGSFRRRDGERLPQVLPRNSALTE